MFAVIRTGGKQHRVAANDRITIERLNAEAGDVVAFDQILMLAPDGEAPLVGQAVPGEARVFGRILAETRGPKLIIFKKKRRKNHRRTKGHRQDLMEVQITEISVTGEATAAATAEVDVPADTPVVDAVAPVLEPALQE